MLDRMWNLCNKELDRIGIIVRIFIMLKTKQKKFFFIVNVTLEQTFSQGLSQTQKASFQHFQMYGRIKSSFYHVGRTLNSNATYQLPSTQLLK
jgi:hypothetical protein